jgi:hypothetical protein
MARLKCFHNGKILIVNRFLLYNENHLLGELIMEPIF